MFYELNYNGIYLKADTVGGNIRSLKKDGVEYIWQNTLDMWPKSTPILFPICCGLRGGKVIIKGKEYSMQGHGLAPYYEYKMTAITENSIDLDFVSNDDTRSHYPYDFVFRVRYTIIENGVTVTYLVLNPASETLPFCYGAHPGFNVPMFDGESFEDYILKFEFTENCTLPVNDNGEGAIATKQRRKGLENSDTLELNHAMFKDGVLIFEDIKSKKISLLSKKNNRGVEVEFKDFPYVGIWSPNYVDAPFVCIEPWSGMSARDDEDDNLESKIGLVRLEAGKAFAANYTIKIV